MWLRCYDCGKQEWDPKDWHMDVYRVKKEHMDIEISGPPSTCNECGSTYRKKWGHPSMKVFLCNECYNKIQWMG